MNRIENRYQISMKPMANKGAMIQGDCYRFTVLTSQLIRLEYNEKGDFEDRATQIVLNRDFVVPKYRVIDKKDSLEIITDNIHLTYNKRKFSKNGLNIQVKGNLSAYRSIWYYGEEAENLKGTARTLDEANGEIPLSNGLLSRNGFSIIDDSKSILIEEDGWVAPRDKESIDLYFLGYGRDYLTCLKDFFKLCGPTPMLPRYALGNWWSRFYRYTDAEYKRLMLRFKKEGIPFSISVLDMDWHLTQVDSKYGSGWTGYTWNKELYPDPKEFMGWLHKEGLHVTLNVHPADGVRAFEEMYESMAKELNVDYMNEDKIPFDISDPGFLQAYFKYLHHPNEDIGVDFWWVDWQQGGTSKIEGIDPLWMLNHFHFIDNKRRGKKPLTFSRYAGIGSHRYPIGFSGDTYATWETLAFQPYFTATASNVGYGWWSHDIGGHMHGTKNDEMAARWIQFGVFSPIMRIHSSDNPFNEKEPWKYNLIVEKTMKKFMRLRHQLIPYLYTMNHRFHEMGEPLIQPMYYRNSEDRDAYDVPNEYYFGTELIICPITKPMNSELKLGVFKAWLPKGIYLDFFTGMVYRGNRRIDLYRDITTIPVLAKAGSIIPMVGNASIKNDTDNPVDIEIKVFAGADGNFQLYEDNSHDNLEENLKTTITDLCFIWNNDNRSEFAIKVCQEGSDVIPQKRNYTIIFVGFLDTTDIKVYWDEINIPYVKEYDEETHSIILTLNSLDTNENIVVSLFSGGVVSGNHIKSQIFDLLNKAQIEFDLKDTIYQIINKEKSTTQMLSEIQVLELSTDLLGALFEIITAY